MLLLLGTVFCTVAGYFALQPLMPAQPAAGTAAPPAAPAGTPPAAASAPDTSKPQSAEPPPTGGAES